MLFLAQNPSIVSQHSDLGLHGTPQSDPCLSFLLTDYTHVHTYTHTPLRNLVSAYQMLLVFVFTWHLCLLNYLCLKQSFLLLAAHKKPLGRILKFSYLGFTPDQVNQNLQRCSSQPTHGYFKVSHSDSKMQPRLWTSGLGNLSSSPPMFWILPVLQWGDQMPRLQHLDYCSLLGSLTTHRHFSSVPSLCELKHSKWHTGACTY